MVEHPLLVQYQKWCPLATIKKFGIIDDEPGAVSIRGVRIDYDKASKRFLGFKCDELRVETQLSENLVSSTQRKSFQKLRSRRNASLFLALGTNLKPKRNSWNASTLIACHCTGGILQEELTTSTDESQSELDQSVGRREKGVEIAGNDNGQQEGVACKNQR